MINMSVWLLCVASFAVLALSMPRQQDDLFGAPLASRATRAMRFAGWGGLVAALWLLVASQGWGLGLVSYSGHTSVAAGLVYLSLVAYQRRKQG